MQAGETRRTVNKRHDRRTLVKVLLVCPPRLQRTAGHVQDLGRLALGDPLGVPRTLSCTQVSALEASPALGAIILATVLVVDYRCHRLPPRPKPLPCEKWRAKDGEGATWFQSLSVSSQAFSRSSSRRDGRRHDRGLLSGAVLFGYASVTSRTSFAHICSTARLSPISYSLGPGPSTHMSVPLPWLRHT